MNTTEVFDRVVDITTTLTITTKNARTAITLWRIEPKTSEERFDRTTSVEFDSLEEAIRGRDALTLAINRGVAAGAIVS